MGPANFYVLAYILDYFEKACSMTCIIINLGSKIFFDVEYKYNLL